MPLTIAAVPFPILALPPKLRDIVETVAERLRVPTSLPACCALSAISAAIGSGLRIRTYGDRSLRGNIYIAAGVPSGSGKSDTFNSVLEPVFERQRFLEGEAIHRRSLMEVDRFVINDQIKKLTKEVIRQNELGNETRELRAKLAALLDQQADQTADRCQIVCDDATGAALEKLLSRNPMFSCSDEAGGSVLRNLLGRFGKGTDESIYVRAYSGGYQGGVDRIGRDSVRLPDPCLTVLWIMQPAKLDTLFSQQSFREDGLLARMLVCRIETQPQKYVSLEPNNPEDLAVREDWNKLWLDLHQAYHPIRANPHILESSREGTSLMLRYTNKTVQRRHYELADLETFAARWAEQAWRLSVVLHAARHGQRAHVKTVSTIEAAIEIADWFSEEQLALLAYSRVADAENRESKVMDLLRSQLTKAEPRDWVTARDLLMSRIVATSLEAQQLLGNMEAAGKLVSKPYPPPRGGHTELRYRGKQ